MHIIQTNVNPALKESELLATCGHKGRRHPRGISLSDSVPSTLSESRLEVAWAGPRVGRCGCQPPANTTAATWNPREGHDITTSSGPSVDLATGFVQGRRHCAGESHNNACVIAYPSSSPRRCGSFELHWEQKSDDRSFVDIHEEEIL